MSQPVVTETTPTAPVKPSDMPGAAPAAPQTAENTPSAPAAPATPDAPAAPATEAAPEQQPGESNIDWKERAKLWEDRAKVKGVTQDSLDKAKKWDEYQESQKTVEQKRAEADAAKDARITELETEGTRKDIARETGVPVELIVGSDEAAMRAAATVAQNWRGNPSTSAAPSGVVTSPDKIEGPKQITSRDELAAMSPADRMVAYRDGRLKNLGAIPGPGDLRNVQHAKK